MVVVTSKGRIECMQHGWKNNAQIPWDMSLYRQMKDQDKFGNCLLGTGEWEFRWNMDRSPED